MTVHVLIWGDLSHARFFGTALLSEMIAVMRQKSAAVIVPNIGAGSADGGRTKHQPRRSHAYLNPGAVCAEREVRRWR